MTGFEGSGTWERDPYGRYPLRWWDGSAWSDQVSTGDGVAITDPDGSFASVAPLPFGPSSEPSVGSSAGSPSDSFPGSLSGSSAGSLSGSLPEPLPGSVPGPPPGSWGDAASGPFNSPPPPTFIGGPPLGGTPGSGGVPGPAASPFGGVPGSAASPYGSPGAGAYGAPPPPPGNYAPQYGGYSGYAPPASSSAAPGVTIAALICGLIGLCAGLVPVLGYLGIPVMIAGIVCGIIGMNKAKQGYPGRGLAIGGLVTGVLGIVAVVLWTVVLVATSDSSINTDPSNGWCNEDRYWQDPDC